ncbi:hypothetical protein GI374_05770 [Paracoccus sp. S-4012]|uniref:hypothetical protein n=1 Tax=Paracoccus sp. S-4012 TaxID=2665648 RepID=UPI0012AF39B6|nr:hypothetical protein [Paracoccus sp. S-4012]MRX49965.1 hypothetical protein [Paracoccus sp. S-4012]
MSAAARDEDRSALVRDLDAVLLRVGRLNYSWSNTESLLVHLLAGLAGVKQDVAVVLFLSLSSTRARIELIERLAKLCRPEGAERATMLALLARFGRLGAVRNRFNHSIWSFDLESGSISTILMRIADRKSTIRMGKSETVDEKELARLDETLEAITALNRDIWEFLARYDYPVK